MKKLIGFILSTVLYAQLLAGNGYYAAFKLTSNGSNVAVNGEMKIYSDEDGNSGEDVEGDSDG